MWYTKVIKTQEGITDFDKIKKSVSEKVGQASDTAKEVVEDGKKKAAEAKDKIDETVEEGKKKAEDVKDQASDAVDDAKKKLGGLFGK